MLKKLIYSLLLIINLSLYSKPPEITPKDLKIKVLEIFNHHANYKKITPDLADRLLKNFLEELDPTKTYLIESEIDKWLYPSDDMLNKVIDNFNKGNFSIFYEIHEVMIRAIQRRDKLEKEVLKSQLPQEVDSEEFKDIPWVHSTGELLSRLLKIKKLRLDSAEKINDENRDIFFKRIEKRRLHKEAEIIGENPEEKKQIILSSLLKAFCNSLDAHTNYFTPSEANQMLIDVQQRLIGIGALLKDNLNGFLITRILENSPCEKEDIKINDRIIAVDNEPVIGMDIVDVVDLIRGEKNTPVNLTILRDQKNGKSEKIDIEIKRNEIILENSRIENTLEPYGDGVIARIKLFSFYQDPKTSSSIDMKNLLEKIKKEHKLKGVVLDLRSNAGGLLPQAIEVTSLFISKGIVASIKDNLGNVKHLRDVENRMSWDGPLVVLINKASASASEIVAQTLQDYGRAIVVGDENSFGKGTFQIFTLDSSKNASVNPKGEYKVTKGKYYTVSGKSPQLVGVKSDITIPGILSYLDIGEKFSKYPLDNDKINPNFDDDLSDIPPNRRKKIKPFYNYNLQKKTSFYTKHLEILQKNSFKRMQDNQNYQDFLKEIKNKNFEAKSIEIFEKNDLQLLEALNITKDLIFLVELNDKTMEISG